MSLLATLVPLALKASIIAIVFAIGLHTTWADVTYLLRHRGLLARSILSMNLVMPVVAAAIVLIIPPHPPLGMMLIALSLCPTPPILPNKIDKAGGDSAYGVSLVVVSCVLAIITAPLSVELVKRVFGVPLYIAPLEIAKLLVMMVIGPIIVGVLVRRIAPDFSVALAKWVNRIATVVLVLGALAILATSWRAVLGQASGAAIVAIILFLVAGLVIGQLLGGPDPTNRTVLALATAARHPGMAVAIAHMSFPDQKGLLPFVLLFLIVSGIGALPYIAWRRRVGAGPPVKF